MTDSFIGKTFVNSFHYLAQDADYLRQLARKETGFERVRLCRTTVLLYVFSLEALINRCMDHFLPDKQRDFFLEREKKVSTLDKFELVPLFVTGKTFDKSLAVWAKLKELFQLRDDFVHPKHDRVAYLKIFAGNVVEPFDPDDEIPSELGIISKDLQYPHLKVPKDPYSLLPEHLERVKDATGDVLQKLNELLEGRVLEEDWHIQDQIELIHPKGATWKDLKVQEGHLPRPGKELRAGTTEKK